MFTDLFTRAAISRRLRGAGVAPWVALALLGACAPRYAPGVGPDAVDPAAAAPSVKAHPFPQSYVARRPVEPSTRWFDAAPTKARGAGQER
jgi:hypothetical protein